MNNNRTRLTLVFLIIATGVFAQEAITTTGGTAVSSDGSISYSVGQVCCSFTSGSTGKFNEGVLQIYSLSTGIGDLPGMDADFSFYPNPVDDHLILEANKNITGNYSYRISGINGIMVREGLVSSSKTIISLSGLPAGSYFMILTDNKKDIKTYTIIKK